MDHHVLPWQVGAVRLAKFGLLNAEVARNGYGKLGE